MIRQAHAAAGCQGPRIVVGGSLSEGWAQTVEQARTSLREQANLDRCAQVVLEPDDTGLRVQVTLEDGRSATRQVWTSDQLLPTLEGVLWLPPPEKVTRAADVWREPVSRNDDPVRRPQQPRVVSAPHLEVGLGTMGRIAGTPLYGGLGLAAFAQLTLERWLFSVVARWDADDTLVAEASPSGFNMQTLAAGVDVGFRSNFGDVALDTLFGPMIRVENQEAFGGPAAADGVGGGTTDARLDLSLRFSLPRGRRVRFFCEGDVDASPWRLAKTRRLDAQLPALPAWSGGVTLGGLWSLP